MKILFLIRSLEAGGAERQLVQTALGLSERGHDVTVLTFYDGGFYERELENSAVVLISLHKRGRWDLLSFYWRLIRALCRQTPDVVYSFLDSANVFSILAKPFLPSIKIVWGVRASNMDLSAYPWITRWSYKAECFLSQFADRIIANSHAGLRYATVHGFPEEKIQVIHNGVDTMRFKPDETLREDLRKEWHITSKQVLIGLVGRIDPMKGHDVFLQAAKVVAATEANARFVCVGHGEPGLAAQLKTLTSRLNLDAVMTWAEARSDMPAVYNALDLLVSASFSEGFSNVIAEAMACGVPCVVTDVGDSAAIVGPCGHMVPPNQPQSLADAVIRAISSRLDKQDCRKRIVSLYSLSSCIDQTEDALKAFTQQSL